jgi:transcriptional regulator with XRE-family HTH domain
MRKPQLAKRKGVPTVRKTPHAPEAGPPARRKVQLSPHAGPAAQHIYRRMNAIGMSAKALSLAAGLNETYVRDLLLARSINPHSDQLFKIAAVLKCEAKDLLDTNPGPASLPPGTGDFVYDAEERAILYLWRMLRPPGRRVVMDSIRAAIPEQEATAA